VNRVILFIIISIFTLNTYACGDNPNAIIQGPFKTSLHSDDLICFQNTFDKRDVDFFSSHVQDQGGSILRLFFVHQAYDVKNPAEK